MNEMLTPNTKAALLLTAPLLVGRHKKQPVDLLKPGEYRNLVKRLHRIDREPADLLTTKISKVLRDCPFEISENRLEHLLARGFLLSQAIEHWQARAIWVVGRTDDEYPKKLNDRLPNNAPAVLYGCGEKKTLDAGGLAVVGSRNVNDELIEYTQEIGRLTARAEQTLVSGGARGIDQAAMRGALEEDGKVTGVLADSLEKIALNREHRNMILEDKLTLISPYDPNAGFNVGNAMQRNKIIYALADAALVVSADFGKGGTWAGATEQLEKLHLVPIYVRTTSAATRGIEALRRKGALPWPNPKDDDAFHSVLHANNSNRSGQRKLF